MVDTAPPILSWVCVAALAAATSGCAEVDETRTYRMTIDESDSEGNLGPTPGVEICELGTDNCVTTGAIGTADFDVPANKEVAFTLRKEGYGPMLIPDVSDETFGGGGEGTGSSTWQIHTDQQLEAVARQLGVRYPWEGGIVRLRVHHDDGYPGTTFAFVESASTGAGEPFYFDASIEEYRTDLEATTRTRDGWRLPLADGGFTGVTRGEHVFEFGGSATKCPNPRPSWGWPAGDEPTRIRIPVLEGFVTYASIVCE